MNEEELRKIITPRLAGILCAGCDLARLIHRPGITIEYLRACNPVGLFMDEIRKWEIYLNAAVAAAPANALSVEEKRLLSYIFREMERVQAQAVGR